MKKLLHFFNSNTALKNFITYGVGQAFNLITPLLVIPYIISVCGLERYGKAAIGMALTFFLIVFIDYGSDIAGVKAVAKNRHNEKSLQEIFTITYCSKFILLGGILFIMSLLFWLVPYFHTDRLLFFLGLPILVGQFLNPTWFLQGTENFKLITILNILSKVIYVIGILLFIKHADDYHYINLWWGIGMIIANGIGFISILKSHSFHFSGVATKDIKFHLTDGFSMFFSQIFVSIQLYAPLILIGFLGSPILAGSYRIVDQVIVIFKTYLLLFFNFAYPRICYLLDTNIKSGVRFWKVFNGTNFLFITISMVAVYWLSDLIVAYFRPPQIGAISNLLKAAVLIPLVMAISLPMKQLVLGFDHQKFYIQLTMILACTNVLLIIIMLPILGIYGVLFSLIIVEALTAILFFIKIKNRLFAP